MLTKEQIRQYLYYAIIGVVSFVSCVFLPMIGSDVGVETVFPTSPIGWIVWSVSKLAVALINIIIFYAFMQQAKINVSEDPHYQEANKILIEQNIKDLLPRSPKRWNREQYGTKGLSIFLTSILSAFALSESILTFDWVQFLSYIFTVVMGLIFGIIQMRTAEYYWTTEYWQYAKLEEKKYLELKGAENVKITEKQ